MPSVEALQRTAMCMGVRFSGYRDPIGLV